MEDNHNNSDDSEELLHWLECREKDWPIGSQHCSFCGKKRDEWLRMFAVEKVSICEECVELCVESLAKQAVPRCGFCGKTSDQVKWLITGNDDMAICEACVGVCQKVLDEKS